MRVAQPLHGRRHRLRNIAHCLPHYGEIVSVPIVLIIGGQLQHTHQLMDLTRHLVDDKVAVLLCLTLALAT